MCFVFDPRSRCLCVREGKRIIRAARDEAFRSLHPTFDVNKTGRGSEINPNTGYGLREPNDALVSGPASAQEAKPGQQALAQPGIRRSVVISPRHGDILHQTGRFPSDDKDPSGHRERLIDVMR